MDRTTPPSTLSAAPFVAADGGLQTYATRAATSSGRMNLLIRDDGRAFSKNCFSISSTVVLCSCANCWTKVPTPSDSVGPGSTDSLLCLPYPFLSAAIHYDMSTLF